MRYLVEPLGSLLWGLRAIEFAEWYRAVADDGGRGKRSQMNQRVHDRRPYTDLHFLGVGNTRIAIRHDDLVYKVPVHDYERARLSNTDEFAKLVEHWGQPWTFPATLWSWRILTMPLMRPLFCEAHFRRTKDCDLEHNQAKARAELRRLMRERPAWFASLPTNDRYETNFGWWRGRLYCFDLQTRD